MPRLLLTFLFPSLLTFLVPTLHAQDPKPNIIFVMADDLGYTDLACYGSQYYQTPHIDRLASQGLRFTNHHHCPNCTPTRAALMSGQYGARTGVYTVGGIDRFDWSMRPLRPVDNVTELPLDRSIFPKQLQLAGYTTGMFGKWHLGQQGPFHPAQRGFDEAIVSDGKHFDFETSPPVEYPAGQYLADFLTDRAIDFISRNQHRPFFLYLPHFGVHAPLQAKPDLIQKFKDLPRAAGHKNPTYAAMIYSIDESIGRIMKSLEDLGLSQNTVLIFTSDNGGVGGYRREGIEKANDVTDNAPLRSGKGSLYEGGTRVPLIVRWPAKTTPNSQCNIPTTHVDFYPTMLELTGATTPTHLLDGECLIPLLKNPQATLQREAIFQHFPGYLGSGHNIWRTTPVSVIQQGNLKLMEFLEEGRLELYDLDLDPSESKNLASERPDLTQSLHERLKSWRRETNAPMPKRL